MSGSDHEIVEQIYGDSEVVRVELRSMISRRIDLDAKIWIDPSVDGLHSNFSKQNESWQSFMKQFPHAEKIAARSFQENPTKQVVDKFVWAVLDKCEEFEPDWITIPCLPIVSNSSRNRINRMICDSTGQWKLKRRFPGELILPMIFTRQDQLNTKVERDKRIKLATNCYERAQADGVWVVDSSLDDTDGAQTASTKRFPGLLALHQDLRKALPRSAVHIGGPYWGLNLILWARDLIDYPAIGVGSGYRYLLSGGISRTPSTRVAIAPLFRRALNNPEFERWIENSLTRLSSTDRAYRSLQNLRSRLPRLQSNAAAKNQIARFYKNWFDRIADNPPAGRALAMYQDLSSAYVLGKGLATLPVAEKSAKRPERPAENFMLMCL